VTSWKTAEGREVLYIRPDAVFDKSKPISGGIPHCFPQFGPGAIQLHGFARNVDWSLAASKNDGGNPAISLLLTDTDYTRAMWPHSFKAVYTVRLEGETLHTLLEVTNTGDSEFDFTASLHSYFGIDDIELRPKASRLNSRVGATRWHRTGQEPGHTASAAETARAPNRRCPALSSLSLSSDHVIFPINRYIYNGNVYDVTQYLADSLHPGERAEISARLRS
jgi:hypothetical protein